MKYPCHCCGLLTLDEAPFGMGEFPRSQTWEICPVCFWEDEDWRYDDSAGGANSVKLSEARENFRRFGAIEERLRKHTRPPTPSERPAKSN
jgi:hypothetical protein